MEQTATHYRTLLAPVYLWMCGGADAAFVTGTADLDRLIPRTRQITGSAVDLGAGFGMHSIPLARRGWSVTAVDTSAHLLEQLQAHAGDLPVRTVTGDLLSFRQHHASPVDLILCMGDTLTHLPDQAAVQALAAAVAASLAPSGQFVATFRNYTTLPSGTARFIPIRSDDSRILTCYLEDRGNHVQVHDLLHTRTDTGWSLSVGQYAKLRLSPEATCAAFTACGLTARITPGPRGMTLLTAGA